MGVRPAQAKDIPALAALAAVKRQQYQLWQPVFHRVADNAEAKHRQFLADQVGQEGKGVLVLVHETEGEVDGFLYLRLVNAPPVYDPGGQVALVDDFVVATESAWPTDGKALLTQAMAWAWSKSAVLVNVVCGPHDVEKRRLLHDLGLAVASEWHVKAL